ncbi:ISP domain-containing protein [Tothia fuscella]|uniref:ISP domain-containing protein n=1 Tax=Tothia fuscella TaxID=1048955 RepID=A0A9P4NPF6_9PEZI|nr:ISP domain-containing protein [Tothia fuscella]
MLTLIELLISCALFVLSAYLLNHKFSTAENVQRAPNDTLHPVQHPISKLRQDSGCFELSTLSEVSRDTEIPDGWYTDSKLFGLERRAIFSKTWLCVTHKTRFRKPGDYLSFNVAGFPFFLILGKDSILRGFHNVCRHRAYTVTKNPAGSSLVLGCGYHGWSYDTKGKLTKAPQFDELPGFKKEDNSLFQIWVRSDAQGLVFVNFDARWDIDNGPNVDGVARFAEQHSITRTSTPVASWQAEGKFNWKIAAQQACEPTLLPRTRSVSSVLSLILDRSINRLAVRDAVMDLSPFTTIRRVANTSFWTMTVVEPISATETTIRCDLYSTVADAKPQYVIDPKKFEHHLMTCVQAWECEFASIVSDGQAPSSIKIWAAQHDILRQLESHTKMERKSGGEIFPAVLTDNKTSLSCGVAERRKCKASRNHAEY